MNANKQLWKIYVPEFWPDAGKIPVESHKEWDKKVCEIAGGMTLLQREKGRWMDGLGGLQPDAMIPVQIACSRDQILTIALMTKTYYKQEAIFFYKVSDEVWVV